MLSLTLEQINKMFMDFGLATDRERKEFCCFDEFEHEGEPIILTRLGTSTDEEIFEREERDAKLA